LHTRYGQDGCTDTNDQQENNNKNNNKLFWWGNNKEIKVVVCRVQPGAADSPAQTAEPKDGARE